jgi:hypothetical protein
MNGIQFIFKSPFLVYPTDSDFFFGLISFHGNGSHSEKVNIQNGGRCHGNQGARNFNFTLYSGSFSNLTQKKIITQSCALCF